jgi:hypothetical protein
MILLKNSLKEFDLYWNHSKNELNQGLLIYMKFFVRFYKPGLNGECFHMTFPSGKPFIVIFVNGKIRKPIPQRIYYKLF